MRHYGYVRVSTEAQAISGLGLEAQRAAISAHAPAGVVIFEDVGVSGGLPLAERPGLLDAIAALGRDDVLIVARRDRLGRDVVNVALIEREVERRGARIVSAAGEGSELEGPTGQLVRTILDAVNAYEKAAIALRTRAALRAKKARGEVAGNCPFGYRAGADGKLVEHEAEQAAIRRARELRAEGWSYRRIATHLERDLGARGRTGQPLTLRRVHEIARSA